MTIREQIRRLRHLRRWNVEDMALLTGIRAEQISAIESGAAMPALDELERIATALGMKVWLVPWEAADR